MKSGYAEREDEAGAAPATPGESSLLEQEEVLRMASFDGISEARKRELDSICELTLTPAECMENEELWEEYFERKAEGLSPEQKNVLWHRIMTSAFETDAGALPPFSPPVKPAEEEEERYVQWRCEFNLRKKIEQLGAEAVDARRMAREVGQKFAVLEDAGDASAAKWVFRDMGATYSVRVPEGAFTIKKTVGTRYLHWFAKHRGARTPSSIVVAEVQGMGVKQVAQDFEGKCPDCTPQRRQDVDEKGPAFTSQSLKDVDEMIRDLRGGKKNLLNHNAMTTPETIEACRRCLMDLKDEREKAEKDGNEAEIIRINEESEKVQAYLDKNMNEKGRSKKWQIKAQKDADSIRKAVLRARKDILKEQGATHKARTAFAEHFKEKLTTGCYCSYKETNGVNWVCS